MPGETEPAFLGQWCLPTEQASSGQARGRAPLGPWGGDRRQAPGTPSPKDISGSPRLNHITFKVKSNVVRQNVRQKTV